MFKQIVLFLIIGVFANIFSQEIEFNTHKLFLKGELTSDDAFEKDFGRFDLYELPMEEGDIIKMRLKASFFPLMIIVAPSNEYKMAFPKDNKPVVIYEQIVDESGLWYIYIAGDSLDTGEHSLELYYVSKNTRKIPKNADFGTLTNFFLAHSITNFFYLIDFEYETKSGKWDVELDSHGKYKSAAVERKDGVSVLTIFFEYQQNLFEELSATLKKTLKKTWNIRINDSKDVMELFEIEGLRKISLIEEQNKIILKISTKG